MRKWVLSFSLIGLSVVFALSGCGSSTPAPCPLSSSCTCGTPVACQAQSYVFATTNARQVLLFPVEQNGGLGLPGSLPGPFLPGGISVSTPSRELFVADHAQGTLYAFTTAGTGQYSAAPGSPYALGSSTGFLEGVATTSDGKFVYVIGLAGEISGFSIAGDGSLTPIPSSPFPVASESLAAVTEASTKFLFVVNSSSVTAFTIDSASGALLAAGPPVALSGSSLAGIEMAATTPTGNFLYIGVNGTNHVDAFSFDAVSGALTAVSGSPFLVGTGPAALTVTGTTLYVLDNTNGTVSALAWDKNTGALSEISGSPFSAPYGAGVATLNGQYLYVTSVNNVFPPFVNEILGYSISSSGALTPLGGSPYQAGAQLWGGIAAH
ncbi:MAG: hypothetical protein DMG40_26175 [Acidobacteria bacterium]|nr:MAG: hypothetical protein DMG40_26175 [Acidobacteriota bacterium]